MPRLAPVTSAVVPLTSKPMPVLSSPGRIEARTQHSPPPPRRPGDLVRDGGAGCHASRPRERVRAGHGATRTRSRGREAWHPEPVEFGAESRKTRHVIREIMVRHCNSPAIHAVGQRPARDSPIRRIWGFGEEGLGPGRFRQERREAGPGRFDRVGCHPGVRSAAPDRDRIDTEPTANRHRRGPDHVHRHPLRHRPSTAPTTPRSTGRPVGVPAGLRTAAGKAPIEPQCPQARPAGRDRRPGP